MMETKKCCFCKTEKPTSEFSTDKRNKTGFRSRCKICQNKLNRSKRTAEQMRLETKERRMKNPESFVLANRKYRAKNKGAATERTRAYTAEHPEKRKAHLAVSGAIRRGKLHKKPCTICGNLDAVAHHPDYSKPLEVVWLCRQHHADEHKRIDAIRAME